MPEKQKKTKRTKLRHKMEGWDQFNFEQAMRITKKDQKGTVFGFVLTVIYYLILLTYIYQ